MAKPIGFRESTSVLGAPPSMTAAECDQLPVYQDGKQTISCWKLSAEELVEVERTGCVWLQVAGGHPPVFITGIKPFTVSPV